MSDPGAARFETLHRLLDVERRAETEQNKLELSRLSPAVRESLGKTVTRLSAEDGGLGEGAFPLLVLSRPEAGEELAPFHSMGRGDLVCVETPTGERLDGTLYEVDEYRAVAAMAGPLPEPLPGGRWTVHLVGSDATHRRMKRALEDVRLARKKPAARLRDVSFGLLEPGLGGPERVDWFDEGLNERQREAVACALSAEDFALVHGPPGTGKTTALVELVLQAVARGARVLATAPSNIAVDNILEKLLPHRGLRLVRLGHPARTLESLRHATLSAQCAAHPAAREVRDLDLERERLARQRSRKAGRGRLGWSESHDRQREIRELWRRARELEREVSASIVRDAQVVLATHGSIGRTLGRPFDLAVLDEASQATEPLSWIPLLQARKAVLAGDPLQLPPTLYSKDAAEGGLALTLFERLQGVLPEHLKTLLRVQYRMNERIMDFPSREFYGGKLIADESVRARLLSGLPNVGRTPLTETPFLFVDTSGTGWAEGWDELLQSRDNPGEAALAVRILDELLRAGLPARAVAVIAPYVAQVRRLKALLRSEGVEVGTVDGFQGREKEALILSLVRSNDKGEVGFLEDSRRMNVALTRARRLLVVIGDGATVARHPLYARLIEHAEASGAHRSAYEWPEL